MLLIMNKTSINKITKQKIYQYAESDSFWFDQNFACILFFPLALTWLNVGFINPKYPTLEESYSNWVIFTPIAEGLDLWSSCETRLVARASEVRMRNPFMSLGRHG